ncbi:hypothetical protein J4417_00985 [Candidatus Woesearchaeota archaeon]|nr:hypothetical protein [Candidatus Woesearchaeota archaeon]
MLENLPKKLDSHWIKKNGVWDIVAYGSYARGKSSSRDLDLAVILCKKTSVNIKWQLSQELKNKIVHTDKTFDVKVIDIKDLLNPGFLGREAILAEGYSIIHRDYLAERFGFEAVALVAYSLSKISPAKQKTVYYALQGRVKGTGILSKLGGTILSGGILQVPTRHYEEIASLLEQHHISYKTTFLLQYRVLH